MTRAIRLALLAAVMVAVPATSFGGIALSITIAPPPLLVYSQPICPGDGYIWAPGYWAYGPYGYYWVPGTWVPAPFIGALWTPGYWGWGSGVYLWHAGYWGPHVGFYGGINYGFGYVGIGYEGGYWNNGSFFYNSTVNHVDRTIVHNVYNRTVINNNTGTRVSYNGGRGGTAARPTAAESAAARDRHVGPTTSQTQLQRSASTNRAQLASANHGRPATLATARPQAFTAHQAAPANHQAAPANRAERNNVPTTHRPGTSAAASHGLATSTHANRQPNNNQRAVSRTAPQPAQHSGRNIAARQPIATHNHPVAQHPAPRSTPAPRRSTAPAPRNTARNTAPAVTHNHPVAQRPAPRSAPPAHYSARNSEAPARHAAAQPHYSAPAQHSAQPHATAPRREGGHGG